MRKEPFGPIIATTTFIAVKPDGSQYDVEARLGQPYHVQTGEWCCPVELAPLYARFADIRGEDSMQSLNLATSMLYRLLCAFLAHGGQLYDDHSLTDPYEKQDIDILFGRI